MFEAGAQRSSRHSLKVPACAEDDGRAEQSVVMLRNAGCECKIVSSDQKCKIRERPNGHHVVTRYKLRLSNPVLSEQLVDFAELHQTALTSRLRM